MCGCCLLAAILFSGCRTTGTVETPAESPSTMGATDPGYVTAPGTAHAASMAPIGFTPEIQVVLASAPRGAADMWTDDMFEEAAKAPPKKKPAKPSVKRGPQADTSAYVDTTDDGKGTIKASAEGFPGEPPANVFDNKDSKWCAEAKSVWIEYHYADGAKHNVTAYTIMTANDMPTRDPKDWKLLGSTDGKTWTEVDSREGESFTGRFEKRLYEAKTPGEYSAYRLEVARNHGDVSSQMAGVELLVKK